MKEYDLIILGAGSAGFAAGIKASELGKNFAIIESGIIGGTCVNVGCVPSKHLLHVSDAYYSKNYGFRGIKVNRPSLNFSEIIKQKDELVTSMRKSKYADVLENLEGATLIEGKGVFVSRNEVKVGNKIINADKFIIATGSSPNIVKFKGIENVDYLTNVEALSLEKVPNSMIVVGGRALGLEFAQMYAHFGTEVTVLQRSSRILPDNEPEISEELTKCLRDEGIEIHTDVEIKEIDEKNGVKIANCLVKEKVMKFESEQILIATGRKPNTEGIGLDKAVVETEKGFVKIDEYLQTSNPNIYAAGDCASQVMLETLAAKMGNIAVRNAFENAKRTINNKEIPRVIFTNPQVATVGFTEEEYSAKTHACACRTIPMSLVPKAQVINDIRGIIKMGIDPRTLKIVGVHIVSPLAADMIHEATLAVKFGLTIDDIIDTVHVFPTLSEATKLVATAFRKDVSKLSCCSE
ncbi:MAG TPA: mercury(II) reductase [Candidatus Bathyarchaeota archaeon]|nr:mercury(II) reductase [Candidatus Bathyarchaeota archaeon]